MTSETEKKSDKKIPYKYGMADPSAYFVARVWQVVEDKAGFALGPKTKAALNGRIKEMYLLKLKSDVVGQILFSEWQTHRKLTHMMRDLRDENERLKDRPPPRVDVVQNKRQEDNARGEIARPVVDDDLLDT
jgi:hypothetical protein